MARKLTPDEEKLRLQWRMAQLRFRIFRLEEKRKFEEAKVLEKKISELRKQIVPTKKLP